MTSNPENYYFDPEQITAKVQNQMCPKNMGVEQSII